jgi:hypothetical protein
LYIRKEEATKKKKKRKEKKHRKIKEGGLYTSFHQRDRYSLVCTGHLLHDKLSRPTFTSSRLFSSAGQPQLKLKPFLVNCHPPSTLSDGLSVRLMLFPAPLYSL